MSAALVDSHCHLDFPDFEEDRDALVERAKAAGVETLVTISTRVKRFPVIAALTERYDRVFCSIGTHPHNAAEEPDVTTADLVAIAQGPKVVAIGEAGLDYHYDMAPREAQRAGFLRHIAAARETQLPLVIHAREADDDMAAILTEETGKGAFPAILHCFSSGAALAEAGVRLGLHVSFSGILTFKRSDELRAIAAARETQLPLVIHAREADDDMAAILTEETGKGAFPAILHCFSSGAALAEAGVRLGLHVSFSGILTFKRSDELRAIAAAVPLDRLLVETDAPYLAPVPHRGRRNEPAYVVETAKVLAEAKGITPDQLAQATSDNFYRLFNKVPRP